MQRGLDLMWPYTAELFDEDDVVRQLAAGGTAPSPAPLHPGWERSTTEVIVRAGLTVPAPRWRARGGRTGMHTEEFASLVAELQS
ncbi:Phenylacetic acid catabolic protein, partial [Pseudomonas aeruginosa]|uniref:Phenylacetic acid catabolic protein n=1 Tax=Pseudomonas aeruginosa TaxID=287 RepID=UPI003524177C